MNYEAIILELGNKIAQLSIDNAVLFTRVQDEMKKKEEIEEKYVEAITELKSYKAKCEEVTINE